MSTLALALLIAGLVGVIGEILVKDPGTLRELAGTREFALARPAHREAPARDASPSNSNERPAADNEAA